MLSSRRLQRLLRLAHVIQLCGKLFKLILQEAQRETTLCMSETSTIDPYLGRADRTYRLHCCVRVSVYTRYKAHEPAC